MSTCSRLLSPGDGAIPLATAWHLQELHEYLGKQELFERQSPERLKVLRESAMVDSAISSNRIEAVTVAPERVGTVLFGGNVCTDRNEEEVRGYRDALHRVHSASGGPLTVNEIHALHRLARAEIWDAGQFKQHSTPIIERLPDGSTRERFMPVTAEQTPVALAQLVDEYGQVIADRRIPTMVAIAAFNLDFLCIHPYRDGNGRVSRLLLLRQLHEEGFTVGRFVSIERLIEESKDRYYETLELSSHGWHKGQHDPWPYINFLAYTVINAYRELEQRWNSVAEAKGAKTERVNRAIDRAGSEFTLAAIEQACPGVSRELIRKVLRNRPDVVAAGRGPGALWCRLGN